MEKQELICWLEEKINELKGRLQRAGERGASAYDKHYLRGKAQAYYDVLEKIRED